MLAPLTRLTEDIMSDPPLIEWQRVIDFELRVAPIEHDRVPIVEYE